MKLRTSIINRSFGISLLLIQIAVWFAVCQWVISDLFFPDWIVKATVSLPVVVSLSAWCIAYGFRNRRLGAGPDAGKMRRHRRRCIASAIVFTLLIFIMAPDLRRTAVVNQQTMARLPYDMEAFQLSTAASDFAENDGGAYPQSLADLPHAQKAQLSDFDYYGDGLKYAFPPRPIVVLVSKDVLHDGTRLLYTEDDQSIWATKEEFNALRDKLNTHQAVAPPAVSDH